MNHSLKHRISQLLTGTSALVLGVVLASQIASAAVPDRPEDITFQPLRFEPPLAAKYRHELSNGVPVYMMQSSEFPLVTVTFRFKDARHLVPSDKIGLANMTRAMIRRGGTSSVSAEDLDEKFDFLAAQVTSTSINALTSNFDEAFALFMDMVRNPGFQEDKVRIYKDEVLETMKQRNDDANTIIAQTADRLLWGPDHVESRQATQKTIEGITIDDLRAFHQRVYQPGNLIIGVVGDFNTSEMLAKLESALSGWPKGESVPDPTDTTHHMKPGLYYVQKDIPQGKIAIMSRGIKRDDPDAIAIRMLNHILGGSGFTSRMMKRIRSDEGLTYGVRSAFPTRVYYPGEFSATSFSKNRTVALTTRMMMEEITKIRDNPVSNEELETARKAIIETFPRQFENKNAVVNLFMNDEWTHRDQNFWKTYRNKVESITARDIQNVAKKYLKPESMAVLIVGNWAEVAPGDPTETRDDYKVSMADFGASTQLPLLDPLTLQPLPLEDRPD